MSGYMLVSYCKHIVAFWMNFTFEQTCGLTRFDVRVEFENGQNERRDVFCIFRRVMLKIENISSENFKHRQGCR